MNIQERKNKDGKITSYRVRVFDHRDSTTGKQIFKNLSVKYDDSKSENWNRKNAEKQGAIFEKGVEELTATTSNISFGEYAKYFMSLKKQAGLGASTLRNYSCLLKKIAPYIGHIRLRELTPNALNKAYMKMVEDETPPRYVHELHRFIHNILGVAFKEGIIPRNYATAATPPKKEKSKMTAMSDEEVTAFFTALKAEENYVYWVFFNLLIASGCRVGELCALSWENIDFDEGKIIVKQHWVHGEDGMYVEDGAKTTAGERTLYLDEPIMEMLAEYREYYDKMAAEYGSKWDYSVGAVFTGTKAHKLGDYLMPTSVREWLKSFLKKHSLTKATPHKFRHTSISLQLQSGISYVDVSKRAGHARPDVTLSFYAHTMKNNDKHCCKAVTKALPQFAKPAEDDDSKKLAIC